MITEARRDAKPIPHPRRDAVAGQAIETEQDFGPDTELEERAPSVQHPRDRYTIATVIEALNVSGGIVSLAAQKLGCDRRTLPRYALRYWEIRQAMEDSVDKMVDLAHSEILKQIKKGNVASIIFYLKTKGRKHGFSERFEVSGPDGGPVPVKIDVTAARAGILGDLRRIAERSGSGRVAEPALA